MLYIITSYHCMQFQQKLMHQTWENGQKPNFWPNFGPFSPNLDPRNFFIDFTPTRYYTLLQAIIVCNFNKNYWTKLEKMTKTLFWAQFWHIWPKFGSKKIFFFKNLALSVTKYHGHVSSCTTSEKNNDPIFKKLSDRQTDRSDFIGCCPTNLNVQNWNWSNFKNLIKGCSWL